MATGNDFIEWKSTHLVFNACYSADRFNSMKMYSPHTTIFIPFAASFELFKLYKWPLKNATDYIPICTQMLNAPDNYC